MAKKKAPTETKAAAKAAKKAKQDVKVSRLAPRTVACMRTQHCDAFYNSVQNAKNEVKSVKGKGKAAGKADEEDLEAILASVGIVGLSCGDDNMLNLPDLFSVSQFQDDWKAVSLSSASLIRCRRRAFTKGFELSRRMWSQKKCNLELHQEG